MIEYFMYYLVLLYELVIILYQVHVMRSIISHLCLALVIVISAIAEQAQMDPQAELRRQMSMKRTACLVLSRYHSNSQKDLIQEIVTSLAPNDQQSYINKMYAVAIEKCMPEISINQAQQFFMQQENFDPSSMFYLLDGIDYPSIANDIENLTPNQKSIIKFIKQFDEEMAVRKQERQAEKQGVEDQNDFGIFGFPIKSFNSLAGYAYIAVFASILIGGFVWGFRQLHNSSLPKNSKKSKSKSKPKPNKQQ